MAFAVTKFELASNPYSGNSQQRTIQYILHATDPEDVTDEKVYDWLLSDTTPLPAAGGVPDVGMQQPNGSFSSTGRPVPLVHDARLLEEISYEMESECPAQFRVTVQWVNQEELTPTSSTYSFDVGSSSETIYTPLSRVQTYNPVAGVAPVLAGINVQSDGTVQGVKVPGSSQKITVVRNSNAPFTQAFVRQLSRARGYVNSIAWPESWAGNAFAPGEVRFLGARGSTEVETTGGAISGFDTKLSLEFAIRENRTNIALGGISEDITLDGWDVLWLYWIEGGTSGKRTIRPGGAYVDRVLPRMNLNTIIS